MFSGLLILLFLLQPVVSVIGPKGPIIGAVIACDQFTRFIADEENYCFYHACLKDKEGAFYTIPMRCALGSKVSDYFIAGFDNPCVYNFNSLTGYDCHRKTEALNIAPPCAKTRKCMNGGTLVYEQNICWCECPEGYGGDCQDHIDFGEAAITYGDICKDGKPMADHCKKADGCLNNGICHNQCDDYWCDCPDHESNTYTGKRCEVYDTNGDYKR